MRTLTGWVAVPAVAALLAALAWRGSPRVRMTAAQFVGLTLALDTVARLDYLFKGHVTTEARSLPSDVMHVSQGLGGHYLVRGVLPQRERDSVT